MKNMKLKVLLVLCALLLLSAFIAERKDPITIFMIGDSTMANKSLKNGNIERGWGQMLPQRNRPENTYQRSVCKGLHFQGNHET